MTQKHHYPYPDQRIWEKSNSRYNNLWKIIFPEQYIKKKGAAGRILSDSEKFIETFAAAHLAEQDKTTCLHYLNLANQFYQAHFRLALNPDVDLNLELDGHIIPAKGKHTAVFMSAIEFHTAFCLAVILRDSEHLIGSLSRYKAENHIDPGAEDLPVDYPYYKFLQGLFEPEADLQALLQEIATLSAPEYMPERRQSYIYNIWLPFIEIIIAALAGNKAEYEKSIIKALDAHIKHYANKKREHLAEGWVPLHICAGAVIAYDQCGFKLPITSSYIPEWLIYRDVEL
ncbi:immunity 49 family protein [Endozoicomonas sp. G2_1]|uniref:immunity 49 family protein n=1 Tax=Endozoicomonas sp. G2_1 TaxID=2821091 RepID=UPI001ADBB240|nr:immunity 49 family protein [Endozoicomonas sp. G2_1]